MLQRAAHISLVSVGNHQSSSPKNAVEVKDRWAAIGEQIRNLLQKACSETHPSFLVSTVDCRFSILKLIVSLCLLMSHRFVARANLGTVYGARPDERARVSGCSWGPGPVRLRSRGWSLDAGLGDRPEAGVRSSSSGLRVSGSAQHRAQSFFVQSSDCDIPPCMRDAPKRRRLDDAHFVPQGGSRPVPGPARRGGAASHWSSSPGVDGSRNLSDFPSLDTAAGRSRLSLRHRRPAGLSVSANGSLDIDQVWLHWGRHQGISRQQLLQCITAHALGSEGDRRFLFRSDEDGHTWVSVAESLRGLPRSHRRRRTGRATPSQTHQGICVGPSCATEQSSS